MDKKNNIIEVKKNSINISFTDNFNNLVTDLISNIKDEYNNYIQDNIFKEIIYNYYNIIDDNINKNYNYLVYKGGNTINEVINNFLNNNINEEENIIKLKEEYKTFIKNNLDTSKRSDIDFNYNVSFEQSENLNIINKIANIIYNKILDKDFEENLYNILKNYIYDYNLYLKKFEDELKNLYNNNNIEIIGLYCGNNLIYNKYDNIFENIELNNYYNDINYIKIKSKYNDIKKNINKKNIKNIIKLNNTIINYYDNKLYETKFDNIPNEYKIKITKKDTNNNIYPFINSYNDTLFFNGCNLKNKYS